MKNNFLVIGSNSFSGAYFIKYLLEKGHDVIGISRSEESNKVFLPYKWSSDLANNFEFVQLDLNSNLGEIIELVIAQQPDYIVNFAAQGMVAESWLTPEHWYQTNVVSQVKLHDVLTHIIVFTNFDLGISSLITISFVYYTYYFKNVLNFRK